MYCQNCGAKIADDSVYCEVCGEKIIYENTKNITNTQCVRKRRKSLSIKSWLIAGTVSVVGILIALVFFSLDGRKDDISSRIGNSAHVDESSDVENASSLYESDNTTTQDKIEENEDNVQMWMGNDPAGEEPKENKDVMLESDSILSSADESKSITDDTANIIYASSEKNEYTYGELLQDYKFVRYDIDKVQLDIFGSLEYKNMGINHEITDISHDLNPIILNEVINDKENVTLYRNSDSSILILDAKYKNQYITREIYIYLDIGDNNWHQVQCFTDGSDANSNIKHLLNKVLPYSEDESAQYSKLRFERDNGFYSVLIDSPESKKSEEANVQDEDKSNKKIEAIYDYYPDSVFTSLNIDIVSDVSWTTDPLEITNVAGLGLYRGSQWSDKDRGITINFNFSDDLVQDIPQPFSYIVNADEVRERNGIIMEGEKVELYKINGKDYVRVDYGFNGYNRIIIAQKMRVNSKEPTWVYITINDFKGHGIEDLISKYMLD
ncbi:zinc-ribbon domain-containing protein [Butyrivibrio sp. JL13D10]|uniref:zinc-ribbon domain-containing protein n=1 Tax=Butyrivibrio sp. JL13D10 TaxID=3236815 RepID=UPI0038B654A6